MTPTEAFLAIRTPKRPASLVPKQACAMDSTKRLTMKVLIHSEVKSLEVSRFRVSPCWLHLGLPLCNYIQMLTLIFQLFIPQKVGAPVR